MLSTNYEHTTLLVNSIETGIVKCDVSQSFTAKFVNNGFLRLVDYTDEQFENECTSSISALIYPDDIDEVTKAIRQKLQELEPFSIESRLLRRDGSIIWVIIKGNIFKNRLDECECTLAFTDITYIKQVEMDLKINEKMLNFAIEHSNTIILKYDPITDTMYNADKIMPKFSAPAIVSNFTVEMLKYGYVFPDDIRTFKALFKSVQKGQIYSQGAFRGYGKNNELLWYDVRISSILDNKGKPIQCVVALKDITEIRHLDDENEFRKSMISESSLAYEANITRNTVTFVEQSIINDYPDKDFLCFSDLVKHFVENYLHKDYAELFAHFCSKRVILDVLNSGKNQHSIEYRRIEPNDGLHHWYKNTMNIIRDKVTNEVKIRCYVKNIDDKKLRELELKYKSERDLLSGMYNKITAEEKICSYFTDIKDASKHCALFLIDIDKFKEINDRFGHVFGDAVISEASRKIMDSFRDNDVVGRVGGDEFIILMKNIDNADNARNKAEQLCKTLRDTYISGAVDDVVSVSIGVAIYPESGTTYEDLYKNADHALYASKERGRNCYTVYTKPVDKAELEKNLTPMALTDTNDIQSSHCSQKIAASIVDAIDCLAYVVDIDEHKILYCNNQFSKLMPHINMGSYCYHSIFWNNTVCEDCPMTALLQTKLGKVSIERYIPQLGKHYKVTANIISWTYGKKVCLITATDITKYIK